MTKDPEQIKEKTSPDMVENLKTGKPPFPDLVLRDPDLENYRGRETLEETNIRILKAVLGSMHDVIPKNRLEQFEALRPNKEDESPGRWIHGETNKGKTFCAFQILKGRKRSTPIKYHELEKAFRRKWECGSVNNPRNGMEWDWRDNQVTCIDDIQNMNLTTENAGLRNELWMFLDQADTTKPRPEIIITSNLSVIDFCKLFEGHQRGSLETRIRRLCREVKI